MPHKIPLALVLLGAQLALLLLCMHLAGRKFGLDFGSFRSALTKGTLILLVANLLMIPFGGAGWFVSVLVVGGTCYLGFMLAFALDRTDAALFTLVYLVAQLLLTWGIIFVWLAASS